MKLTLSESLGSGNLGTVWVARDPATSRVVAYRRIHDWIVKDPRERARLGAALAALRELRHTHLLPVLGSDLDAPSPWIASELAPGGSLAARLAAPENSRGLPAPAVLRLALEGLEGLACLHEQGRLHGNLKPANVLFAADGRHLLGDACLSGRARTTGLTLSGAVIATLAATAPEVLRGCPPHPGSDLFSLGLLLLQGLTGAHPNRGRPLLPQFQVPDLRSSIPGCPPFLDSLIRQLLEGDPAKRPTSSRLLARELAAAMEEHEAPTDLLLPVRSPTALAGSWPAILDQVLGKLGLEARGLLGRGAMAWVLDGWDARLERRVAVKVVLSSSPASSALLARLMREARTGAALAHESLLPVYDAGEVGPHAYLVMPVVEGATLEQLVGISGPMSADEVRAIGIKLCGALDHIHSRGILHRDIKPSNVLMDGEGHAFLSDLGLVSGGGVRSFLLQGQPLQQERPDPTEARLTADGAFLGTPGYSAPEVLGGAEHSMASDLYQLGATLHFALEGRRPLDDSWVQKLIARDPAEPLPLDPQGADLDPEAATSLYEQVLRIVQKACRLDPSRRHESVKAMAVALGRAGSRSRAPGESPIRTPPAGGVSARGSTAFRAGSLAALVALGLLLVAAGLSRETSAPSVVHQSVTGITRSATPQPAPDPARLEGAFRIRDRIHQRLDDLRGVQRVAAPGAMGTVFNELRDVENLDEVAPILLATVVDLVSWLDALHEVPLSGEAWYPVEITVSAILDNLKPSLRTSQGKQRLARHLDPLERRLRYDGSDLHHRVVSLDLTSALAVLRAPSTGTLEGRIRNLTTSMELLRGAAPGWRDSPAGRFQQIRVVDGILVALESLSLDVTGGLRPGVEARSVPWRLELLALAEAETGGEGREAAWLGRILVHVVPLLSLEPPRPGVRERVLALGRRLRPALQVPANASNRALTEALSLVPE